MVQPTLNFPDKNKGYICPCCDQFVKIYKRAFNSNMGVALLVLYKNRDKGFVHLESLLIENGHKRCGDAAYLRWYKLIEPMKGKHENGSNRNGYYKITGLGIMFCENKMTVKANFEIFNNKVEGFSGDEINIFQSLGKKFSYQELMSN